jgi:hypothetical protein
VLGLAPPLSPKAPHGERRVGGGERGVKVGIIFGIELHEWRVFFL